MKPIEQQIAIAEACGLANRFVIMKHGLYYKSNAHGYTNNISEAWIVAEEIADEHTYPYDAPVTKHLAPLPDYLNDLNAMHGAEKTLTPSQRVVYTETLCAGGLVDWGYYPGESQIDWMAVSELTFSTASQRAEAFLRTIGKWKD